MIYVRLENGLTAIETVLATSNAVDDITMSYCQKGRTRYVSVFAFIIEQF